ncbi:MAG TPA: LuxR C-terminal-related transcriptional regulator [Flavisolibacter sp.]
MKNAQTVLTKREHEILSLSARGLTAREVADELGISSQTVRKHLQNAYSKLNVNNKIGAILRLKQ